MLTPVVICPILSSGWIFVKLTVSTVSLEAAVGNFDH
jgi:hypothetical protein